jgi:hypothetical protein
LVDFYMAFRSTLQGIFGSGFVGIAPSRAARSFSNQIALL